jgi:hypothetical protein
MIGWCDVKRSWKTLCNATRRGSATLLDNVIALRGLLGATRGGTEGRGGIRGGEEAFFVMVRLRV